MSFKKYVHRHAYKETPLRYGYKRRLRFVAGNDMFEEISNYKRTKPTINYPACSFKVLYMPCAFIGVLVVLLSIIQD